MAAPPDLVDIAYIETLYPEADTAIVNALISPISAAVKKFCRKDFYSTAYTEYLDIAVGQEQLYLKQYPIVSVASIYNDPDWTYAASSLVTATDYAIIADEGIIQLKSAFLLSGRRSVKITYTSGFGSALANIPADVKEATARWIMICAKMWSADQLGVKSLSQGEAKIVYDKGEPPVDVRATLVRHRRLQA